MPAHRKSPSAVFATSEMGDRSMQIPKKPWSARRFSFGATKRSIATALYLLVSGRMWGASEAHFWYSRGIFKFGLLNIITLVSEPRQSLAREARSISVSLHSSMPSTTMKVGCCRSRSNKMSVTSSVVACSRNEVLRNKRLTASRVERSCRCVWSN